MLHNTVGGWRVSDFPEKALEWHLSDGILSSPATDLFRCDSLESAAMVPPHKCHDRLKVGSSPGSLLDT